MKPTTSVFKFGKGRTRITLMGDKFVAESLWLIRLLILARVFAVTARASILVLGFWRLLH